MRNEMADNLADNDFTLADLIGMADDTFSNLVESYGFKVHEAQMKANGYADVSPLLPPGYRSLPKWGNNGKANLQ